MSSSYSKLKVGQALEDKDLGPVISNRQKQVIQNYLNFSKDLECFAEGHLNTDLPKKGHYVLPKLYGDVKYLSLIHI